MTVMCTDARRFPEPFHAELQAHGETIVVIASGEIDLNCADHFGAQLRELLGGFRRVVLDLRDLDFIDCSGLHRILEIDEASRAAGVEFALVRGSQQVHRLFQMTNTERALRFIDPSPIART